MAHDSEVFNEIGSWIWSGGYGGYISLKSGYCSDIYERKSGTEFDQKSVDLESLLGEDRLAEIAKVYPSLSPSVREHRRYIYEIFSAVADKEGKNVRVGISGKYEVYDWLFHIAPGLSPEIRLNEVHRLQEECIEILKLEDNAELVCGFGSSWNDDRIATYAIDIDIGLAVKSELPVLDSQEWGKVVNDYPRGNLPIMLEPHFIQDGYWGKGTRGSHRLSVGNFISPETYGKIRSLRSDTKMRIHIAMIGSDIYQRYVDGNVSDDHYSKLLPAIFGNEDRVLSRARDK